jgi:hypothetical protein
MATLKSSILLTATFRSTIQKKRIVAFQRQQLLRKSTTILRYNYISHMVTIFAFIFNSIQPVFYSKPPDRPGDNKRTNQYCLFC